MTVPKSKLRASMVGGGVRVMVGPMLLEKSVVGKAVAVEALSAISEALKTEVVLPCVAVGSGVAVIMIGGGAATAAPQATITKALRRESKGLKYFFARRLFGV